MRNSNFLEELSLPSIAQRIVKPSNFQPRVELNLSHSFSCK